MYMYVWQSTRPCVVTLTYADTLTRGVEGDRVVILVLYAYCQSYSDLHGYSDKGGEGGKVVILILYTYCQSYSDLHGYSDKEGVRVVEW